MRPLSLVPALLAAALLAAAPALADGAHSGIVHPRTGPEPSDVALFVAAAVAVWLARRALRRRGARDRDTARAKD